MSRQSPLVQNNEGCALVGAKPSTENSKNNNYNFACMYSMFVNHHICVVCDLMYVTLAVGIVQNPFINLNIPKC